MPNQTKPIVRLEAEIKSLRELEARYNKAILENEAFVLLKKLYLEMKQLKEELRYYYPDVFVPGY